MVGENLADQFMQRLIEVLCLLQTVGKLAQLLRHDGVQRHVGAGNRLGRTQHTEFKLVAGKGQGAGTVPVGGILGDGRHGVHADTKHAAVFLLILGAVDDGLDDGIQFITQEDGNNGGRCFAAAQAVVIAGGSNGAAQEILIFIHALQESGQEQQEPGVLGRSLAWLEEVFAGISSQGPVIVLTGAVDAGKGLFMKQAHQIVLGCHLLHDGHHHLVVIAGGIGISIDGCQLMLAGSALVVLGLGQNAQSPQLLIQFLHEAGNTGTDGAEIMVIQLLTLGRQSTKQGPSGEAQVFPLGIQILGQQEIFLLSTHLADHAFGLRITEKPQNADSFPGNFLHGAQQRGLLIQGLTGVGEEAGRDIQASVSDKSGGCGIPGGIAAGFKGCTEAAVGEGRAVGFALHQLLAGEFHDDTAVTGGSNKGIVLFSGDAGHGLEPMGIVGGALLNCPDLHGLGDLIGNFQGQLGAVSNAGLPGIKHGFPQTLAHGCLVKNIAAKHLGYIQDLIHTVASFPK